MKERLLKLLRPKKILKKNLHKRAVGVLAVLMILGFGSSIFGLAYTQLVKGEFFKTKAQTQQLSETSVTAQRGVIYDANMTVLAQSAAVWKVTMNPMELSKFPGENKELLFEKLIDILGVSRELLEEKASHTKLNNVVIKGKVEKSYRDALDEFLSTYYVDSKKVKHYYKSAVTLEDDVKRYYPYSNLASQIIGFTGNDNDGLSGLEYYYNNELTGIDGRIVSNKGVANYDGSEDYESVHDAVQGTSLVLTMDETIQRFLESALQDCYETSKCDSCCGIVMDVKTGAILAMSSKQDYDLNDPFTIYDEKTRREIEGIEDEDERSQALANGRQFQWNNRAVTDMYEPGSVFKVITMAAGLEENVVKYDETFNCSGSIRILDRLYYCHNHSGHGTQSLTQGLMNSCNPFFITIGQRLGADIFYKYFEAFGFTEKTGIDLPGESLPKKDINYFSKERMTKVNLASSSFGQSFKVTPLQMLTAINAVANGGKLMKPYIVGKTLDIEGNVLSETKPTVKRQVISESTSEKILASMDQVSTAGTAKNSYIAGYHMAGKTGTSDDLNEPGKYIASFAGAAPSYDPRVSVIIVVNHPQGATGGGAVAAPVAAEVMENTLTYLNVERRYNDSEKELLDKEVPSLIGMTVDEADEALDGADLGKKVIGDGEKVVSQIPSAGQYIPQGGVVVLYTESDGERKKTEVPDFTGMSVSDANYEAVNAGINIKVSGNALERSGLVAYRQSVAPGTEIEVGSTVTVYFRTNTGVSDH